MKPKSFFLITVLLASLADANPNPYELVWADEFNEDGAPNPENWTYEHGFVRNEEAQWYQPQNAACSNGLLVIEARRERVINPQYKPGSYRWNGKREYAEYTSACLITKGLHSWKYGRFEMRAKIDVRPGLWPAFWTLGNEGNWPDNGEIDIMEYYRGSLLANLIWETKTRYIPQHKSEKIPLTAFPPDWADQFHVWRMDWEHDFIRLYVDDQLLNELQLSKIENSTGNDIEHPFRHPHYILLNLAVGGTSGGDPSQTEFPARLEVDYVRVYQKKK